jgi:CheY-like chemotaxis protein
MTRADGVEWNLKTLDPSQVEICAYLASGGERWFSQSEIAKRAGGKKRVQEDPRWALRALPGLVELGIVEINSSGHYRLRSVAKEDVDRKQGKMLAPDQAQPADGRARKILFVDDDKDWRELGSAALHDCGYEVLTARDATEALVLTEAVRPDLIILDLDLAGESGLTLMNFLRHNQAGVPIVLFTGLSHDEEQIQAMLRQGAHVYVRKGPLEDLLRAVRTVLFPAAPQDR